MAIQDNELVDIFTRVTPREIEDALRDAYRNGDYDDAIADLATYMLNGNEPTSREMLTSVIQALQRNAVAFIADYVDQNPNGEINLREAITECVYSMYKGVSYLLITKDDMIFNRLLPHEKEVALQEARRYEDERVDMLNLYRYWHREYTLCSAADNDNVRVKRDRHNPEEELKRDRRVNLTAMKDAAELRRKKKPKKSPVTTITKRIKRDVPMAVSRDDFNYDLGVDVNLLMKDNGSSNLDNLKNPSKLEEIKNQRIEEVEKESLIEEYNSPLKVGPIFSPSVDHAIESAKQIALSRSPEFNINNVIDVQANLLTVLYTFPDIETKNLKYSEIPELLSMQKMTDATKILDTIAELKLMVSNRFVLELASKLEAKVLEATNDFFCYDLGYYNGEYQVDSIGNVIPIVGRWIADIREKFGEEKAKVATEIAVKFSSGLDSLVTFNNHIDMRSADLWGSEEMLCSSLSSIYSIEVTTIVEMPIFVHELKVSFEDYKCVLDPKNVVGTMVYNVISNAHSRNKSKSIYLRFIDGTTIKSSKLTSKEDCFLLHKLK